MGHWEQTGAHNRKHAERMAALPRYHWRRVDWLGVVMTAIGLAIFAAVAVAVVGWMLHRCSATNVACAR